MNGEIGVYVHLPWCVRKCPYCDFNSHPDRTMDESAYLAALRRDLKANVPANAQITSVYFGGGTPSLFSPASFDALLTDLGSRLAVDVEITMEANPGTTEHRNLGDYRAAGINRLSLGAQSFADSQLKRLGRIHGAADIYASYLQARRGGFDNINLDLMYGLPGQAVTEGLADLGEAVRLGPEHVSWYQLTVEPKTEFAQRPPKLPEESHIDCLEDAGRQLLAEHGYHRYEVSAYGTTCCQSRHNLNYWTFGDYLGLGAGAHGKLTQPAGIVRTSKPRQPRLYMADPVQTATVAVHADELIFEFMLNALRLRAGVSFETFEARTGLHRCELEPRWSRLANEGLVSADRIATTSTGYRYVDSIVQQFLT